MKSEKFKFPHDQLEHEQLVATLKETEQHLLDVEEVAGTNQLKGVTGDNDDEEDYDDCGDDVPVGICQNMGMCLSAMMIEGNLAGRAFFLLKET